MTLAFLYVLLVFCSARLTRLVTYDTITEPTRTWAMRRLRSRFGQSAAIGAGCPYCAGFWLSALVVLAAWAFIDSLPLPLAWVWAVAGGQMLVNGIDLRLDTH